MSNRFLGVSNTANQNLTNGSMDIFINSIKIEGLKNDYPLKTNSTKQLISSKLEISDINNLSNLLNNIDLSGYVKKDGSVVMTGNLELPDLITSTTTSLNDTLRN